MPASFLSVAQETGLIALIDRWAIEEGCHELQRWHSAHAQRRPLMLCLNLSAQLFHQTALVNEIRNLLVRTQVPAGSLVLEIIEGTVIEATDVTIAIMHHLKALGVRLLIDDFGVGYSSLSYLKRFPVEGLKIDGSFVEGMTTGSVDMAIVNSVVSLAHALDLRVVAEGIETLDQWALLRDVHCDFGQGYLFDAPLTAAEVNDLLRGGASAYGATAAALQAQHPALPPVPSEPLVAS
jgi:EAL domain-containing protein (putative c-di-GMP-specific phosphodiesterase class I)